MTDIRVSGWLSWFGLGEYCCLHRDFFGNFKVTFLKQLTETVQEDEFKRTYDIYRYKLEDDYGNVFNHDSAVTIDQNTVSLWYSKDK